MKFWTAPRVTRGDFFFAVLGINIAYLAALFWLTNTISVMLMIGFRTSLSALGLEPVALSLLKVAADLALLWFVVRRIRDTDHSGWWAAGLLLLPLFFHDIGALVSIVGILALFIVRGTRGPNRFGPDPHGFASRERFEEQQRRLKSGEL